MLYSFAINGENKICTNQLLAGNIHHGQYGPNTEEVLVNNGHKGGTSDFTCYFIQLTLVTGVLGATEQPL